MSTEQADNNIKQTHLLLKVHLQNWKASTLADVFHLYSDIRTFIVSGLNDQCILCDEGTAGNLLIFISK